MPNKMSLDNPPIDPDSPPSEEASVHVDGDVSGQVAIGKDITQIGDVHGGEITIGQRITNFIIGNTEQQRAQRNRQAMLELVRNIWVKGVLEQSLHGATMIELGLEEKPEAVKHPWGTVLQTPGRLKGSLPPGTNIVDVFDGTNGALLILGEPGSGKTTTLLELARHTIARAEEDPTQPMPVVFNLSSWAEKRRPIAEWLVEELNTKYNIPREVAQSRVENDELLLLLDGLDEVKLEYRESCVQAINDFRRECGMIPLAICSRIGDYEALATRLELRGAVLLQPLTLQQINTYLDKAGTALTAVRETLQSNTTFQELIQTPLMLSVMTLAYQGMSTKDLLAFSTTGNRQKYLFDHYVERMFKRFARTKNERYPRDQVVHWLSWLARQMSVRTQTVFSIEMLQPDWLPLHVQQPAIKIASQGGRLVFRLVRALFFALIAGLAGALIAGLAGALIVGLVSGVVGGLLFGLVGGLAGGLSFADIQNIKNLQNLGILPEIQPPARDGLAVVGLSYMEVETIEASYLGTNRPSRKKALFNGLLGGLVVGLVAGLFMGLLGKLLGKALGGAFGELLGVSAGGLLVFVLFTLLVRIYELCGRVAILRFALRYFLYRKGYFPWRVIPFLNYCTERILLRKVGDGYIFIHRLLQEYFASLYEGE